MMLVAAILVLLVILGLEGAWPIWRFTGKALGLLFLFMLLGSC